ncbi:hypothetical protein LDENG_00084220 [Lucifuga dentata]|nr:hypothetical protein LDENG_00084220 [Lucifuga dentata]
MMAEAAVEAGSGEAQSPLVQVTFQRNPARMQKYLESEPKALGITQIVLSVFEISSLALFLAEGLSFAETDVPIIIASLLVIIAGSVAVAAQNLHLPTLKACLGMQIIASAASLMNVIVTLNKLDWVPIRCWNYHHDDNVTVNREAARDCIDAENAYSHLYAENMVIHMTLVAISITLAAYCCKVINCCSPARKMPVITVQTAPAQD